MCERKYVYIYIDLSRDKRFVHAYTYTYKTPLARSMHDLMQVMTINPAHPGAWLAVSLASLRT